MEGRGEGEGGGEGEGEGEGEKVIDRRENVDEGESDIELMEGRKINYATIHRRSHQ